MGIWRRGVAAAGLLAAALGACSQLQDAGDGRIAIGVGGRKTELISPDSGTFSYPGNDEGNVRFGAGSASITRGTPAAFGAFSSAGSFSGARTGAGVVAWNGFLYVTGGFNGSPASLSDVQVAPIGPTGALGAFSATTPSPRGRAFHGAVAYNGFLYLIGGQDTTSTSVSEVVVAPIHTDGTLGSFTPTTALPDASSSFAAVAANGWLYVIGGAGPAPSFSSRTNCRSSKIHADGTLDPWVEATGTAMLPVANQAMASAYWNGRIYLAVGAASTSAVSAAVDPVTGAISAWQNEVSPPPSGTGATMAAAGGVLTLAGNPADTGVYSALIGPSGRVSTWVKTGDLGQKRGSAGVAVWNDRLYLAGGQVAGTPVASVLGAPLGGPPLNWVPTTSLPSVRWGAGAAAWNGYVYVVGGSNVVSAPMNEVLYAQLNADGTVGAGGWKTGPTLNQARIGLGLAVYNGRLYAIGGFDGSGPFKTIEVSTIGAAGAPGTWAASPTDLGLPLGQAGATVVGDRLYVGGGVTVGGVVSPTLVVLNIDRTTGALSTSSATAAMPQPIEGEGLVADGNWLYSVGGQDSTGARLATVQVAPINPATGSVGSWSPVTSLPGNLVNAGVLIHAGSILVAGGNDVNISANVLTARISNPDGSLGPWQAFTPSWTPRTGAAVAYSGGSLLVIGGSSQTGTIGDVQVGTSAWVGAVGTFAGTSAVPSVIGRYDPGAASSGGRIYLAGGYSSVTGGGNDYPTAVSMASVNADGTLGAWSAQAGTLTVGRQMPTALAYNGNLYVAGGFNAGGKSKVVEYGAIASNGTIASMAATTPLPISGASGLEYHAMAAWNGNLYVIGGEDGSGISSAVRYAAINANGTLGSWVNTNSLVAARELHAAVAYNGYLYLLGGRLAAGSSSFTTSVEFARINADGTIPALGLAGTWAPASSLLTTDTQAPVKAFARDGVIYLVDGATVQAAPIHADGTLGDWQVTGGPYGVRSREGVAESGGYLYILGGNLGGATSDVEVAPLLMPAQRATYTRLFDLGAVQASADTITVTGSALSGAVLGQVAVAGADGKLGPFTPLSPVVLGTANALAAPSVRWVFTRLVLDDGAAPFDFGAARDVTGLSLAYTSAPAKLAFSNAPQTLTAGACANGALQFVDGLNKPVNMPASLNVTFAAAGAPAAFYAGAGCGGAASGSLSLGTNGSTAPFSFKTTGAGAGALTLTATTTGLAAGTQVETVNPDVANHLLFTTQPVDVQANATFPTAPVVTAYDALGNVATGFTGTGVNLLLGAGSPSGSLFGNTTAFPVAGVSTFTGLAIDTPGTGFRLSASTVAFSGAVASATFNVTAAAPAAIAFTLPAQPNLGGGACAGTTLELRDAGNHPVAAAAPITVTLAPSGPTAATYAGPACAGSPTSTVVIGAGSSTTQFSFKTTAPGTGSLQLAVSASGLTGASQTETIVVGPLDHVAFTTQPADAVVFQPLPTPPVVTYFDLAGNVVTGATLQVGLTVSGTCAAGGGPGVIGTFQATPSSGVANFPGFGISCAGTGFKLNANVTGLPTATSSAFNVTTGASGAPATLAFTSIPTTLGGGACGTVTVEVETASGTPVVTGSAVTVNLASTGPATSFFPATDCSGAAATSVTVAATASSTSFGFLTAAAGVGSVSITATAAGLSAATQPVSIIPGAAQHLAFTTQPVNTTSGVTLPVTPVVKLFDRVGNVVTSATNQVALTLTGNPVGILSGTTTVSAVAGAAAFTGLSIQGTGSGFTFTASAGLSGGSVTSNAFTVAFPGGSGNPPAAIAIVSAPQTALATGTCAAVVLEVHDASGAPTGAGAGGLQITLAATPAGAVASGVQFFASASCAGSASSQVTVPAGQIQVPAGFKGTVAGTFTLGASSTAGSASQSETLVGGGQLAFTGQPATPQVAGVAFTPPVVVAVQDGAGNLVSSDSTSQVTLSLQGGAVGAVLKGNLTATASSGLATFAGLVIEKAGTLNQLVASSTTVANGATSAAFEVKAAPPTALTTVPAVSGTTGPGTCTRFTVQLSDGFGNVSAPTSPKAVSLVNTGSAHFLGFFSDSGCSTPASSVTVASGLGSADAFFKADGSGTVVVQLTAPGLASGTLTFTISTGPVPTALSVFGLPSSIKAGTCAGPIEIKLLDQDGRDLVAAVAVPLTVNTSGIGGGPVLFADAACSQPQSGWQIAAGSAKVQLWIKAATGGSLSISASSSGLASSSGSLTVIAGADTPHLNGWSCAGAGDGGFGALAAVLVAALRRRRPRPRRTGRSGRGGPASGRLAALALLLLAAAPAARAAPAKAAPAKAPSANDEAKAFFQAGQIEYNLGHHQAALELFEKAYKKKPVPALLYNIAQCHRMLGDLKAAQATYRSFIANAPDSPVADTAREKLQEVEKALAAQSTAQNAPPVALEQPEKQAEPSKAPPKVAEKPAEPQPAPKPPEKPAEAPAPVVQQHPAPPVQPPPAPPQPQAPPPPQPQAEPAPQPQPPAPEPPALVADARPLPPPRPQAPPPRIRTLPEPEVQRAAEPAPDDRRSFGPNLYFGGVSDPKNKEVGMEAGLVLSPAAPFSIVLGAAIGQHIGVRASAFLRLVDAGPLRLWIGPRLLFTPGLTDGSAFGGGGQLRAEIQALSWLDLVVGAGAEVYKAPSETVVAPLVSGGLQTRF